MHPLAALLEWFPEFDFGVLDHGFAPHGRDYFLLVESSLGKEPGRYRIQFTHVTELRYSTAVDDDVWEKSWGEAFIDYQAWQDAGEPDGYVWGTCWSLAWPGLRAIEPSPRAAAWSARVGKPMYETEIDTDRFSVNMIFHSVHWAKISDETSNLSHVLMPLSTLKGAFRCP